MSSGTYFLILSAAVLVALSDISFASAPIADSTAGIARNLAGSMEDPENDPLDSLHTPILVQPPLEWHSMISRIPGDWVRWSKETFRAENVPEFLGIAALTYITIVTDEESYKATRRTYEASPFVKSGCDFFTEMGDGRTQFGVAGAFGLYGLITGNDRALRTGSQIIQAVLSSGTVVQVLKHITGRESPFVSTQRGGAWVFFPNQIEYHKHVPHYDAYPSGHIATSTATVVVIAENYPESKWIRPVGFTIVGLIGLGMAGTGIHWYSDYPLGIALGYMFGLIAAHPEGIEIGDVLEEHGLQMNLVPTSDGTGVGLGFRFRL